MDIAKTLETLAGALAKPVELDNDLHVLVPAGFAVQKLEKRLDKPLRTQATHRFLKVDSFLEYIERFKEPNSIIYAHGEQNPKFTAVINHYGPDTTDWGDHRAEYRCPLSSQWEAWTGQNGTAMAQAAFARFIEDNLEDIAKPDDDPNAPDAATMLEVSRTLEAKNKVQFASAIRLDNGEQQFIYQEDIQGTTSKGTIKVPEYFYIGVPAFNGGEYYKIKARLRYRIKDAQLLMWYDLYREDNVLRDAYNSVLRHICDHVTLPVFEAE